MKNNYPIRYAVMPIIAQIGWTSGLNELERKYEPIVYIVSKCYLVKTTNDFNEKGEEKKHYKVVFPYQSTKDGYKRVEPEFNYSHFQCINGYDVDAVYKTYEEAQERAIAMNKEIVNEKISYMEYDSTLKERIDRLREEMRETIEYYNKLSTQIEETTSDLVVDAPKKEQNVIGKHLATVKIRDMSLYEFIRFYENKEYRVYHVTEIEFEELKKKIQKGETSELSNYENSPLIINDSKDCKAQIMDSSNLENQGFYIKNGYMYYDDNIKPIDSEEDSDNDSIYKVYTIESYEEVIESYITNFVYGPDKAEIKVGNKTFQKKLDF